MRLFALQGSERLGTSVAQAMDCALAPLEERTFAGGEHKTRPLISVRGEDVYVLQSLDGDERQSVNDKLVRLLFFLATCRENGAARVSAVVPYLAYSRKDRQTKPRDPVSTQYVARLFEAVGTDMVITVDVHNLAAFQNAFRCGTTHLDTIAMFAGDIRGRTQGRPVVICAPDSGAAKRAQLLRESLEAGSTRPVGLALMEKRRSADVVSGGLFAGDVSGRIVVVVDDMIESGGTIIRAARACRERGAAHVLVYAAHGVFAPDASEGLCDEVFDQIIVTDSVARTGRLDAELARHVTVLSCAPLLAEAIKRLHGGGSIHRLLEP